MNYKPIESDLEINLPQVLYKYRSWNDKHHKRFLSSAEFYFAHPLSFNDPFDVEDYTSDIVVYSQDGSSTGSAYVLNGVTVAAA